MNRKEIQKLIEVLVKYEKRNGHKGPASAHVRKGWGLAALSDEG